jgi:hypothetical protein
MLPSSGFHCVDNYVFSLNREFAWKVVTENFGGGGVEE